MRKLIRKILKIIGSVLAVILLALAGYIIYLYASYHRIEDNLQLQVETTRGTANETNNETTEANPESDYFPDIRLPRHCAEAFRYLHPLRNFLTWTDATVFPECR